MSDKLNLVRESLRQAANVGGVSASAGPVDKILTAEQLEAKYSPNGDGEHPDITLALWRGAVLSKNVIIGYWPWVVHELNS